MSNTSSIRRVIKEDNKELIQEELSSEMVVNDQTEDQTEDQVEDQVEEPTSIFDEPALTLEEPTKSGLAVVSPKYILEQGIVTPIDGYPSIITDFNDQECQLQQNGIDLRLDSPARLSGPTHFRFDKASERRGNYSSVPPQMDYRKQIQYFSFDPSAAYSVDFMEQVDIPDNMMAYIIVRSSVNRFSGSVASGVWDSGFRGRLGTIYRPDVFTTIERGIRMAQIVFWWTDSARLYEGQFQDQSSHSSVVGKK